MIKGSVKRPILTTVIFVILIIIGAVSLKSLPIDLYPNIEMPMISILTTYPGASAEDVEKQISKPLEDFLGSISNMKKITSTSQENLSVVTLEFDYGTDLTEATNDVRDALDFAKMTLPADADQPRLLKFSSSMMPIILGSIKAENPGVDLRKVMDEKISKMIGRVDGVGAVSLWGGIREMQVKIKIDKTKIENLDVSLQQIMGIVRANNFDIPAGNVRKGEKEFSVRVPGEFNSIDQIENLIVGFSGKSPIYLKDIADVTFEPAERINYVRLNGKPSPIFMVTKQSGANSIKVANGVVEEIKKINKEIPGVQLNVLVNNAESIVSSIRNLSMTILFAIILVIIVTLFLLNNLRASLIVASVIPVSLIVAFIFLFFSGGSLNIISLSAIAITIGMVVDNAIVVLENTFHHREKGESREEASIFGTQEVIQAITASTITTIVIFLPLFLVRGLVGILFKQLAATVPIILATSLFTSMTLAPMLSSKFLKIKREKNWNKRMFAAIERWYKNVLSGAILHKTWTLTVALIFFIIGLGLFKFVGTEFIPTGDIGFIEGDISMPLGTPLEETNRVMKRIEEIVKEKVPEAESYSSRVGRSSSGMGAIFGNAESPSSGRITIRLVPKKRRKRTSQDIAFLLQKEVEKIPGIQNLRFAASGGMNPMGMGSPIQISIFGDNLDETDQVAKELKDSLRNIRGISTVDISFQKGSPEMWVQLDRDKLNYYGLSVAQIGGVLRTGLQGSKIGNFRRGSDEYDIYISLNEPYKEDFRTLHNLLIQTSSGKKIPLGAVATIKQEYGPFTIEREENERVIYVNADIYGRSLGQITRDIKNLLKHITLPDGVHIKLGGQVENQAETFSTLFLAIILGIILVYLVMAAQFESFLDPFIIMFSVPFAIIGVSLAFYITGVTMSLMGMIGILMLIGIVVNNAIVLIDYVNILRMRGIGFHKAVIEGSARRLRPVLMTALTTIFGLLPLAISRGEGSEMWSPLGISVIGGLIVSTFVTLIIIPVIYSIFESGKKKRREV